MKRSLPSSLMLVLLTAAAVLGMGGCPLGPSLLDWPTYTPPPTTVGTYWVESTANNLSFYRLPAYRGDPGTWSEASLNPPDWFTGTGIYELADDGTWTPQAVGDGVTLDEFLQLYDPAPPAP